MYFTIVGNVSFYTSDLIDELKEVLNLDVPKICSIYLTQQINSFTSSSVNPSTSSSSKSQNFQQPQKSGINYNNPTTNTKKPNSKVDSKPKDWRLHSLLSYLIANQRKCTNNNCPFKYLNGTFKPHADTIESMCKTVMKMDKNTALRDQLLEPIKNAK
jgi:hypothetical protein